MFEIPVIGEDTESSLKCTPAKILSEITDTNSVAKGGDGNNNGSPSRQGNDRKYGRFSQLINFAFGKKSQT